MVDDQSNVKELVSEIDFLEDGALDFHEIKMWGVARLGLRGDIRDFLRRHPTLELALKAYIKAADLNGDGTLNENELMCFSAFNGSAASKAEVQQFIKDADTNGDGMLTYDELKAWALKTMGVANFLKRMFNNGKDIDQGLDRVWTVADSNKDGFLTLDELVNYLKPKGVALETGAPFVKTLFEEIDQGKDGKLSKEEMKAWAQKWHGFKGDILQHTGEDGDIAAGIAAYIAAADTNGDGMLTQDEIRAYSAWKGLGISNDQLAVLYEQADSNKDGNLTADEITKWLESQADCCQADCTTA